MYVLLTKEQDVVDSVRLNVLATHRLRIGLRWYNSGVISHWILRVDRATGMIYKMRGMTVVHRLRDCAPEDWRLVHCRRYRVS